MGWLPIWRAYTMSPVSRINFELSPCHQKWTKRAVLTMNLLHGPRLWDSCGSWVARTSSTTSWWLRPLVTRFFEIWRFVWLAAVALSDWWPLFWQERIVFSCFFQIFWASQYLETKGPGTCANFSRCAFSLLAQILSGWRTSASSWTWS